eukprot:COSAG02_NODE_6548_length_3502_cov_3.111372_4_plen_51_part_00
MMSKVAYDRKRQWKHQRNDDDDDDHGGDHGGAQHGKTAWCQPRYSAKPNS